VQSECQIFSIEDITAAQGRLMMLVFSLTEVGINVEPSFGAGAL
jgi:hypothetical protein